MTLDLKEGRRLLDAATNPIDINSPAEDAWCSWVSGNDEALLEAAEQLEAAMKVAEAARAWIKEENTVNSRSDLSWELAFDSLEAALTELDKE